MNPYEQPAAELRPEGSKPVRRNSALISIIAIVSVMVIIGSMFYFVVPKFAAIYKDFGVPLPRITIVAIELAHLVVMFWPVFVIGLALMMWGVVRSNPAGEGDPKSRRYSRISSILLWILLPGSMAFLVVALAIPLLTLLTKLSG